MQNRHVSRPTLALSLVLWSAALVGYFGPWIGHRAAALAWNAYDLFEILRFLPEIETLALIISLQTLRLPLIGLALLLPLLLAPLPPVWRWLGGSVGAALALATLPPYPQIVGAWRTPGWRIPFWWGVGGMVGSLILIYVGPRLGSLRPWLITACTALTAIPALLTFNRLLPAVAGVHRSDVHPGWGFWSCSIALLLLGFTAWLQGLKEAS
ncbi:MAG: hypothetical protein ACLFU8_05620 [Anaerolineales bacterium]